MRLLDRTPWRENAHRRLIGFLARAGRRSDALAQYESCRRILLEELNVEPSPATELLAAAIRDNTFPGAPRPEAFRIQTAPAVHHLPRQFTPFFGRDSERARIGRLLEAPETALVTIIGPGGVGKTRLALAAGADQKEHFAHGVHFVPLVGLQHVGQFIPALAELIGFSFSDQPDRPSPREQLLGYLAQRELLLILDNAEHLEGFHEELLTMLQHAPGVKLLVTSRHELALQAAAVIHLHGLPFPPPDTAEPLDSFPAMQLLLDRIRRRDERVANPESVPALVKICRLVEGYPLALELAAGLVPAESPGQIAGHIIRSLDTLRVGYHDFPERHLSLRALFDHSWNLLSTEEQRILPQLTFFRGGFTVESAHAVSGASEEILRELVGKSLLQIADTGRYSLHNVPRYFLVDRLPTDSAADAAHAAYFMTLFRAAAEDLRAAGQVEARQRLQLEEDNLHAAWQWTCAAGDRESIAASLPGLFIYWSRRGYAQVGVDFFTAVTGTLEEQGVQDMVSAVRMHALGCIPGEEVGVQKYLMEALAAAGTMRAAEQPIKLAMAARLARQCMASLAYNMNTKDKKIKSLLAESCDILVTDGSELDVADVDLIRARMEQHQSNYLASRQLFTRSVEVYRRYGDWHALADSLYHLARLEYIAGSFASAADYAAECQALYTRLGNRQGLQDSFTTLGFVAFQAGQYVEAQAAFETSLRLSRELGNHSRTANNLSNLGVVAVEMGKLGAAREWYEQALAQFSELNDDAGIAIVLANQGILAEKSGDLDLGVIYTQKSLSIRQRIGDAYGLAYARNNLGFIYLAQQEYKIALQQFHIVLQQGISAHNANWQADALGGTAIAWAHTGRLEDGLELAGTVLAEEATSRYVRDKLEAFLAQLDVELPASIIESRLQAGRDKPFGLVIEEIGRELF